MQVNNYRHSSGYPFFVVRFFVFYPIDTNEISPDIIAVAAAGSKETLLSGPFRPKSDSKSPY